MFFKNIFNYAVKYNLKGGCLYYENYHKFLQKALKALKKPNDLCAIKDGICNQSKIAPFALRMVCNIATLIFSGVQLFSTANAEAMPAACPIAIAQGMHRSPPAA